MGPITKRIAFLFCIWPLIVLSFAILLPHRASFSRPASTMTPDQMRAAMHRPPPPRWLVLAPLGFAYVGAIILLIDSFMREYDSPRGLPIALAVMGLITVGATSAVYYLFWGWLPAKRDPSIAEAFCDRCVSETTEQFPKWVGTHNLIGTRLIGRGLPCNRCGSTIKTFWIAFLLPIVPLGSYRVLPIGKATASRASFIARKCSSLYWTQVLPNFVLILAIGLLILYQAQVGR